MRKTQISFNEELNVAEAPFWDRKSKQKWCTLSAEQKLEIRLELNYYKLSEMKVHPHSLHNNQYYMFLPGTLEKMMKKRKNAKLLKALSM
ncbi:Oidioi.mRNA.OKI2018_I69.chr2.g8258.t1.cds [Oikopleura dioica]|uniref:Oidioi.mRNA.OKI2018_I69.chr2.g8258.t1.cds n=1 Tax=Oikopleura dioica TaxID=34765 RepID=A0ABN7T993_OIKDI|nr:Oidioi.mRNA.OKI2018_I69.chr2.g8258.t1.cds [Oikopleura dioica]